MHWSALRRPRPRSSTPGYRPMCHPAIPARASTLNVSERLHQVPSVRSVVFARKSARDKTTFTKVSTHTRPHHAIAEYLRTESRRVDDTKTAPDDDLWLSDLDGEHEKSNNTRPVKQPRSPSPSTQLECKRIFVCIVRLSFTSSVTASPS